VADEKPPATPTTPGAVLGLQIRLPFRDTAELRARCGADLARGALFVRTRKARPAGTRIRFDARLADGAKALQGLAVVARSVPEDDPSGNYGMLLQFSALDAESHTLLRGFGWPQRLPVLAAERIPGVAAAPVAQSASGGPPAAAPPAPSGTPPPAEPPTVLPPAPPSVLVEPTASPPPPEATPAPPRDMPSYPRLPAMPALPALPDLPDLPPLPAGAVPIPPPPAPEPAKAREPEPPAEAPSPATPAPEASPPPAASAAKPSSRPDPGRDPVVGIDLGTTNAVVAWTYRGKPIVVPSRGGPVIPSVVAVDEQGRILVGQAARNLLVSRPRDTIVGAKRLMGRPFHSPAVAQLRARCPYELVEGPKGETAVRAGGKVLTLQEVAGHVLREVREAARGKLNRDIARAVVAVPAWYTDPQRAAVREAGELAGLRVEQLVNEPTAAALAWAQGRNIRERVLVYDLGGGTFDVSVVEMHGSICKVVATGGDVFLGGADFDVRVMDLLLERWAASHAKPFAGGAAAQHRLLDAAERGKIALSTAREHRVHVPALEAGEGSSDTLDVVLTRAEVERATASLVDRTLRATSDVLGARALRPTDVDEVLLVGGQSRMPLVRDRLESLFGKPPHEGVPAGEAVALGAALCAETLGDGQAGSVVVVEVLPTSIGVGGAGGRFVRVIPKNTPLPHVRTHTHATTRDDQTSLELAIFQGENEKALDNEYLGSVRIDHLPRAPRGAVKVDFTFRLTKEALLSVEVREGSTGTAHEVTLATREAPERLRELLGAPERTPGPAGGGWLRRLMGR